MTDTSKTEKTGGADFTRGGIAGPLAKFAFPVLLAMLLQTLYGAADMAIVGRFCDAAAVAAVSTGGMVMQSVTVAVCGLAAGTAVLLGQLAGQTFAGISRTKDNSELAQAAGGSAALFTVLGIIIALVMQPLAELCVRAMSTPEPSVHSAVSYVRICAAGAVFIVAFNVTGSVFRGLGSGKVPLLAVAVASVVNVALDWILVGWFGLGAAGAAWATVASQAVSVVASLGAAAHLRLIPDFTLSCVRFSRNVTRRVLKLGLPIAAQDVLVSFSFLVLGAIVNGMGVVAAAGVGVAERVCGFIMLVPSSVAQAVSAFAAQNMGAGRPDRARQGLLLSMGASLAAGVVMAWLAFVHGRDAAALFVADWGAQFAAASYLKAYAIDCVLVSFLFCFIGYFTGLGRSRFVMVQGIVGAFCVRIPVAWLMSRVALPVLSGAGVWAYGTAAEAGCGSVSSVFLVGLATPASSIVQIVLCAVCFVRQSKRRR